MNQENLNVYSSGSVINWYRQLQVLLPVEEKIFRHYNGLLRKGHLLDIGIGGGRTTAYLLNKCGSYTGIDYSEGFVRTVSERFPQASCLVADARALSAFEAQSFDVVNFSFNGIDYVDLQGREKIISEISRVLKPGGLFFFSTHNKLHPGFRIAPWRTKSNSSFINIKTFIKLLPFLLRKARYKKKELIAEKYAIINDSAHNYSLMTFYTSPHFLREQLSHAGFEQISLMNTAGEQKEDPALDEWIFVTASRSCP